MIDKLVVFGQAYRATIGAGVLLLLLILGWYFWGIYPANPREAVPAESAIVFNANGLKSKESQNDSLSSPTFFRFFPSLLEDFRNMQPLLAAGSYVYTVDHLGKGRYALSAVIDGGQRAVLDSLHRSCHRSTSVYLGIDVHQLQLPTGKIAYACYRNLLLLGRLPLQVEQQLAQLDTGGSPFLERIPKAKQGILITENLPGFLAGFLRGAAINTSRSWAKQKGWLRLGWERDSLGVRIKGTGLPRKAQPPADSAGYRVLPYLPAELAWCQWSSFDSPEPGDALFDQHIRPWMGNDKALLQMPLPGKIAENQVLLLRTLGAQSAEQGLLALGEQGGTLDSYRFQLFTVRRLFVEGLLAPLGVDMENPYTVVLGEYVAFSPSKIALEQTANAYLLSQHLATQPAFHSVWPEIADGSARGWFFFNGRLGRTRLREWLANLQSEALRFLEAYPYWAGSVDAEGQFQLYGIRTPAADRKQAAAQLWIAPLQAEAATPPYPYPEGGFLLQDADHRLYFFNQQGARLWTFALADAMIGPPRWVDFFDSGPPCIALTTRDRLYVLDPQGRAVGRYPQPWPSPALSPLLVANMEGERAFRSFVGTARGVYGYTQDGQALPAWSPYTGLDSTVRQAMRYQQYGLADHMIALTEKGTLYSLQREGSTRFDALPLGSTFGATFSSPPYIQADDVQQRIAVGDEQGFVHAINLEGTHFRLRVLPGASNARFHFVQLLGDSRRDYLAWDSSRLTLHYYQGQSFVKHLAYRFPRPPSAVFVVKRSGQPHIGWWSDSAQRIYLISLDGEMVPGFPLAGSTPFRVQALPDGSDLLIVGYGRRVYGYRLE